MTKYLDEATVRKLYLTRKLSIKAAAEEAGVSAPTFLRYLRLHKVPPRPPTVWCKERRDKMAQMRKAGYTYEEIAKAHDVTRQRVHQILS